MPVDAPLTAKFLTGESYYRFAALATKGLGLFTTLFVLHALTVYQYGVLQLLLSIFSFGGVFLYLAGVAVSNDIHRFIAQGDAGRAKRLFIEYNALRLALGALLTLALAFGAPLLSYLYQPNFIALLQILALYFFVEAATAALLMLVKTHLDFRAAALEPVWGKVAQLAALAAFSATIGIATREALLAGLLGSVVSALSLVPGARIAWRRFKGAPRAPSPVLWGVLKGYGKWDAIRQVVSSAVGNVQPWLIKTFISTEAVAIYSVALTLVDVAKSMVTLDTFPALVPRRLADPAASRRTYVLSVKYFLLAELLVAGGAVVAAPAAIYVLFPNYIPSLPYFYALMTTVPFNVLPIQTEMFLVALREQKFLFFASAWRNLATPALLVAALPVIGLWGAVLTKLFVLASITVAELRHLFKKYPLYRFTWREINLFGPEDYATLRGLLRQLRELLAVRLRSFRR